MSKSRPRTPKYRHYKPKNLAVVRIAGHDHYLGKHGSPESYERYDRLIAEWLVGRHEVSATNVLGATSSAASPITVNKLILAFWQHARRRYVKNGQPTSEIRSFKTALRPVRRLYGKEPVTSFGPLALVACRQTLIDAEICRKRINQHLGRIRAMFKWGVAREMVPEGVWRALCAVEGLRFGEAIERPPIKPVPEEHVNAVEPFVTPQVWAMINLQLWSACRPGEVCIMRAIDINMKGNTWELTGIAWAGRQAVIVFDSDVTRKPSVKTATAMSGRLRPFLPLREIQQGHHFEQVRLNVAELDGFAAQALPQQCPALV